MANELFASLDDIQAHLPPGKAEIEDADDDLLQVEAFRLIRAKLASTFATSTITTWVSPATTPEIIRTVAGMVIAAKWFAELYAEDSDEDAKYANNLYNQAMALIADIQNGNAPVIDIDDTTVLSGSGLLSSDDFYPNDTVPPKFTMDKEFA